MKINAKKLVKVKLAKVSPLTVEDKEGECGSEVINIPSNSTTTETNLKTNENFGDSNLDALKAVAVNQ